jgi:hypothetical protein
MTNKVHDDDFGANRCCPDCDKENQKLTLASLMLTDEERQAICPHKKERGCGYSTCKDCPALVWERAAIIKAVRVLVKAGLTVMPTNVDLANSKNLEMYALLKEVQK